MAEIPVTKQELEYDVWPVVEALFKEKGLATQHLESYNNFIDKGIQDIIDDYGDVTIETPTGIFRIEFGQVDVKSPRAVEHDGTPIENIYPSTCRLRGFTYSAPLQLEVKVFRDDQHVDTKEINIGDMPVMIKSDTCTLDGLSREELIAAGEDPDDPGGYFIINGSERAIVSLEDLASNGIITSINDKGAVPKYVGKVLSVKGILRTQVTVNMRKGVVKVKVPWVNAQIPFVVLMRALGFDSDEEIARVVGTDEKILDAVTPSFEAGSDILTADEAITFIGNRAAFGVSKEFRDSRVRYILDQYLFPHVSTQTEDRKKKGYFLAEIVRRVAELSLGLREPDDRDHYANKRLRLAGPLLGQVFSRAFKRLIKDMEYQLERRYVSQMNVAIEAVVRPSYVTSRLYKALATGTWSIRTTGVTQLLDRTNFLATLSHLRRLQSPLTRTRPQFEARELHASQMGRICPVESPEGQNIGLVKNLALSAIVSRDAPKDLLLEVVYGMDVVPVDDLETVTGEEGSKIFLNGDLVGFTRDAKEFVDELRHMRSQNIIQGDVGIRYAPPEHGGAPGEVYVNCDAGRILRPMVVVEDAEPLLTKKHIEAVNNGVMSWSDLVEKGVIELIDAGEEYNILTAYDRDKLTEEHTHMELAPYLMYGASGSFIPYSEHNQSPRNAYEAAMAKQALGVPYINLPLRVDTRGHLLVYPQKPLSQTRMTELLGINEKPVGQNLVVAVMSMESYNMEDAVVVNKSSVDRGAARSIFYRSYTAEARRYVGGTKDTFEIPDSEVKDYAGEATYRLLQEDGIISKETEVDSGDVIIGRTSPPRFQEEFRRMAFGGVERRDSSVHLSQHTCTVDEVFLTTGSEGERKTHVRTREMRIPELGDKFASRHGQKGVIGMLLPQEDMPYTESGIVPDLIINPHAFPSRMTVGQFLESMAGKIASMRGQIVDGTPFVSQDYDELGEMLSDLGFKNTGTEVMYDGRTGRKYKAEFFVGVVYYQKLHHMVADKVHARAHGPVQMLTRQPTEGRSRGGGLRVGEMEKDTFVAYGASSIVHERLLESSDETTIYVCTDCGLEGYYNPREKKYVCPKDGEDAPIVPVKVSYAFRLLLDELKGLNIYPRLDVEEVV